MSFYKTYSNFVKLIQDMYSKTKACVQLESGINDSFDSVVGLKQGCNLSPTLFNIFVNDLLNKLTSQSKVSVFAFADDLKQGCCASANTHSAEF